ncbi:ornithine cyclodeaminase family protein [Novosphingobium piscinae]|uniref:Ornithine cyclodeaminase family protein n=1 Tax=Novosphingobium piscinae TaxID=1507448 RepID=A0A7X1FXK3_9SPHN|nr:ornithine cyclodeaminase family protein [Novosphingobium piscinae]MBC2668870.1 ornithine cyclodeaminase family protein [Novosphingobium piscinae]
MSIAFYDAAAVAARLDYRGCIAAVRAAMAALSSAGTAQPLRQIIPLGEGRAFATMPGGLDGPLGFGAKLISVFAEPGEPGRSRHQGLVVAFDPVSGAVVCAADAETVTAIRTACATAAATDALARPDARTLAIFGTGLQAEHHLRAMPLVRSFERIILWGRDAAKATALAARLELELDLPIAPTSDGEAAASAADVICTVTGSPTPVIEGAWVRPGTHVNLVGSSHLGPVEADVALVAAARYIADYRPGALAQGAELAAARAAGLVGDDHVVAEIGEVFAALKPGRRNAAEITLYKSLGHVVQDLAAARYLHQRGPGEAGA